MKADRVRYDPRTGDVLATGTVDARIAGRRLRAEKLQYRAGTQRLELANLVLEGLTGGVDDGAPYAGARGNGSGGVPVPLPPHAPASARLGVPWLEAATASAPEDLSRIQGTDGVRIGAGGIAIRGDAFDLDPTERRLEVLAPVLRLRAPRARARASVLRASLAGASNALRFELSGEVRATIALPFALRSGKRTSVSVSAERLDVRPRPKGSIAFVVHDGKVEVPATGLALSSPRIAGKIRGRHLLVEGDLRGKLCVAASAFPERGAARRRWVILGAKSLELAPPAARPAVWFGGETPGKHPWRLVLKGVLVEGDREPRPELVLYRPTWG